LHDRIISLRGEIWARKISFTSPCFIEVSVPSQENVLVCICVLGGIVLGSIVLGGIDFTSFYDFSIAFWNCSESVVIFLNFITLLQINYCNRVYLSFNCC
jgi:hypothetical protein